MGMQLPKSVAKLSEAAWQRQVIQLATMHGWSHYHTHDSRKSVTGFPDLVLVKDSVIYAELKTEDGKLSPSQEAWVERLKIAEQVVYVWRPSMLEEVMAILRG